MGAVSLERQLTVLDFRLKAVTFDNVPWVITMKKNDHYFPTMEFIKDPKEECGWRRITYENGQALKGVGSPPPEAMDEAMDAD